MTAIQWIESWLRHRKPGEDIQLSPDTDLYKTGLLDSLGVIELIEAIEDEYDMLFTDEEMQAGLTSVAAFETAIASRA